MKLFCNSCLILVGLLEVFCETLLDCVNKLPGDGRTMVGFLSFDHTLHFYNLKVSNLCVIF